MSFVTFVVDLSAPKLRLSLDSVGNVHREGLLVMSFALTIDHRLPVVTMPPSGGRLVAGFSRNSTSSATAFHQLQLVVSLNPVAGRWLSMTPDLITGFLRAIGTPELLLAN